MFPLTSDIIQFQKYVLSQANEASEYIQKEIHVKKEYRRLSECVLALTVLLNRKRIGEVQYLTLKTYNSDVSDTPQEELLDSLTDGEKLLTKSFKRVVTGGKGSKPVAILFPKSLQKYINILLSIRDQCVPKTNEYLFANLKSENRWLSGYHTLRKLAEQSGVNNKELFTSTRLRKQIATILQVSKLLLAINKGKGATYKGKSLEEMEFSDNVDSDTDVESSSNILGRKNNKQKRKKEVEEEANSPIASTSTHINKKRKQNKRKIENKRETTPVASTSSNSVEPDSDVSSSCNSDSRINLDRTEENLKPKIRRVRWTEEQKSAMKNFFKEHIKHKKVPKKDEIEKIISENKKLFKQKGWVKIKAFVYNCYK
ncbi:hypothetical protein NQ314_003174 [Rhamnusium bicolor]|uniref:Uncharacterized protein n=1 Tax=Rhamnusium bicolor TaxID=1586634 RepID=A0AAV8ZMM3_9CUCU|nr:hypothetical protein NQ314_003174 [Rhamnusium bicolor]